MAYQYFDDWEQMVAAAEAEIKVILEDYVAPVAEKILERHIESDIYSVYTPKTNGWVTTLGVGGHRITYRRRHVLEGDITSYLTRPDTLFITSKATASPSVVPGYSFRNRYDGSFLKLLETGHMGVWRNGFPRPAVSNTQKEIDSSNAIKSAIKRGIKGRISNFVETI